MLSLVLCRQHCCSPVQACDVVFLLGDEARLPSLPMWMGSSLTHILVPAGDMLQATYLVMGKLAPDYENVELNVGGSTVAAAVREATGG